MDIERQKMEGQLAAWRGLEPSLDTTKHCKEESYISKIG
jgi:hypothetical protein